MILNEILDHEYRPVRERTALTIEQLRRSAARFDMREIDERFGEIKERLEADNFRLIVVGRFKNGKSTLMNALLGRTTHPVAGLPDGQGPMATNDLPTTATLTEIKYADTPYVRKWLFDDTSEEWSFADYHRNARVRMDEEENDSFFRNIKHFEVGYPAELCRQGVTMLDSPGTSDTKARTRVVKQAVRSCDAALVVFRSDPFAGEDERAFVREIVGSGTRVFYVVNQWSGRPLDDQFRAFVWNRLVKDARNGSKFSGQEVKDFADSDIYFLHARMAEEGKLRGDRGMVRDSGLELLEQRLADFLLKDRRRVHLTKFVTAAAGESYEVDKQLQQRRHALSLDREKLELEYRAIQPQLTAIRSCREQMTNIFPRYTREAELEIKTRFNRVITEIRVDLPGRLRKYQLPSRNKLAKVFNREKMTVEAAEFCMKFAGDRIERWTRDDSEMNNVLKGIQARMFDEIRAVVETIEQSFQDMHFQLTGHWFSPGGSGKNEGGERFLNSMIGLYAVRDISEAVGVEAGWKGLALSVGSQMLASFALVALRIPIFLPLLAIVGWAAHMVGASHRLDERVKEEVLKNMLAHLDKAPAHAAGELEHCVQKIFSDIESKTMRSVLEIIESENRNLRSIMDANRKDSAEKGRLQDDFDRALTEVAGLRSELKGFLDDLQAKAKAK